ncbi:PREDICTED: GATA transcription factor 12-like [Ipomoea nil]|uniref:GATA transcription factor 12-like n=1 Tax=Ipomoea nil TaxID=35883 RepID=UPI00090134D9|nr:PREDICTED: GATA transcription factor 12-like [Ipomoea nil]
MAIENSDADENSSGLCVPPDSLDDLDFFPNFSDDFISITDLFSSLENETIISRSVQESRKGKRKTAEGRRRRYSNPNGGCGWKKRKCSHCETEDTPQWRMGPLGPNTLCNACGVRYKSGRLVPEYRPVASPTFDSSKHSNFHRKIMQHRRV